MLKISTMMVVLYAPFNPSPMYLPLPLAILTIPYLTPPAVTKGTRSSVKYKHVMNKQHGKK